MIAGWTVSSGSPASAIVGSTTTVSAGPSSFQQATPSGGLTTSFTSNVPLTLFVQGSGTQWWASRTLTFTNRSSTPLNVDCAVVILRAPSGAGNHPYANAQPYGHPQKDYLEVPRGDGTSFYIIRLGFHDVPLNQRIAYPGKAFTVRLDGPDGPISLDQTRDSVRFYADLNLSANTSMILKYGTNRLPD
ncbi:MAG: hypothetical protein AUG44_05320 [Actinobacteria bacterium 13_1_20CM_3_71_11]|nr:MAG: hypothetical protein AUG44_05320 [Actinobacteria bacterium 13_1_20CM_3_71_11]